MNFSRVSLKLVKEESFDYSLKRVTGPKDIVDLINEFEELDQEPEENIVAIVLNTKNQVLAYSKVAKGGVDSCHLDMKSIFKLVLSCNGTRFILVHNHPSGDSKPSSLDYELTEKVKKASKLLDMELLDHIVIGDGNFTSCREIGGGWDESK